MLPPYQRDDFDKVSSSFWSAVSSLIKWRCHLPQRVVGKVNNMMAGHTMSPRNLSLRRWLIVAYKSFPTLTPFPAQWATIIVILKFLVIISVIFKITSVYVPKQYTYTLSFTLDYFYTHLCPWLQSPPPWSLPQFLRLHLPDCPRL